MPAALELRLAEPNRAYWPCGTVRGQVRVWVVGKVDCESIGVSFRMSIIPASGEARSTEPATGVELPVPELAPGTHDLPFEIDAPSGPMSHDGKLFRIKWKLVARGIGTSQRKLETSERVQLAPAPDESWTIEQVERGDPNRLDPGKGPLWLGALVALLLLGGGALGQGIGDPLVTQAGFLVGGLAGFFVLIRLATMNALGTPQLVVTHAGAQDDDGGHLDCSLWIKKRASVSAVEAQLVVFERDQSRRRTRASSAAGEAEESIIGSLPIEFVAGDPGRFDATVHLPSPSSLPATWQDGGCAIHWALRTKLLLSNGTEHSLPDEPLRVLRLRGEPTTARFRIQNS